MMWPTIRRDDWDAFGDLRRLQREMNRLIEGYGVESEPFPALNVYADADKAVVTAEVPGVEPDKLGVSVKGSVLTIEGERAPDELTGKESEACCHRSERGFGKFIRSLSLPYEVDGDKVAAKCRNGVLTLTLPRAEATKPRQIAIGTE